MFLSEIDEPTLLTRPEIGSTAPGWPVSLAEQYQLCATLTDALIDAVKSAENPDIRRIGMLALPALASFSFYQAELALAASRDPTMTIMVAPDAAYLAGKIQEFPVAQDLGGVLTLKSPAFSTLRGMLRTMSWTAWHRLPRALLRPDIVAITHNELLRAQASRQRAVGFRHATRILEGGTVKYRLPANGLKALQQHIAASQVRTLGLSGSVGERLMAVLETQAALDCGRAEKDLARLREVSLPSNIWTGTGGYWPARAVGLEVLRRGGSVTRFDHAASLGLRRNEKLAAQIELAASSAFVVPTPAIAERLSASYLDRILSIAEHPKIIAADGDRAFLKALVPCVSGRRRRLLYGPPPMLGARRVFPPLQPDAVGLDWQRRLLILLKRLPVETILRPHPEGLFRGQTHPLNKLHPCSAEPYEALLKRADVLLFDYMQTTTFTMALCTDRPIILLDFGSRMFSDDIEELIDSRCLRIPVSFDLANRPHIDEKHLLRALNDIPAKADPGPFRALLLGSRFA